MRHGPWVDFPGTVSFAHCAGVCRVGEGGYITGLAASQTARRRVAETLSGCEG